MPLVLGGFAYRAKALRLYVGVSVCLLTFTASLLGSAVVSEWSSQILRQLYSVRSTTLCGKGCGARLVLQGLYEAVRMASCAVRWFDEGSTDLYCWLCAFS
jgi:hypothetical protein